MKQKHLIPAIVINGFNGLTIIGIVIYLTFIGCTGANAMKGEEVYHYFTVLSNLCCAIISLVLMAYEIRMLIQKQTEIPHGLLILKQTGTVLVSLTFLTVACFLAPSAGATWYTCYEGSVFFLHFLNPILAVLCFLAFEKGKPLSWQESFFAVIPMFCYSILYLLQVVVFKNWPDFYGFTFGGWAYAPYVVFPVMVSVTYLISFLLSFCHKKIQK